jgi:hypothetical protein
VPGWNKPEVLARLLADPDGFAGDRPIGATVVCPHPSVQRLRRNPLVDQYLAAVEASPKTQIVSNCHVLLGAPLRSPPR